MASNQSIMLIIFFLSSIYTIYTIEAVSSRHLNDVNKDIASNMSNFHQKQRFHKVTSSGTDSTINSFDNMPHDKAGLVIDHLHVVFLVYQPSPFLELVLDSLSLQNYPHNQTSLSFILAPGARTKEYHRIITSWIAARNEHSSKENLQWTDRKCDSIENISYQSKYYRSQQPMNQNKEAYSNVDILSSSSLYDVIRSTIINHRFGYLLLLDSQSRLTNSNTFTHLISLKKARCNSTLDKTGKAHSILDPFILQWWSNFWDSAHGFNVAVQDFNLNNVAYVRSDRYLNIIDRKIIGTFHVPLAFGCTLFSSISLPVLRKAINEMPDTGNQHWAFVVMFAYFAGRVGIEFSVTNLQEYGHLIDPSDFDNSKAYPELYIVETNPFEWKEKYLNVLYNNFLQYSFIPGCNDVFKVPFFSISFAKELIEECERFGEWSSGDTRDERLSGGYEPVPTQDIHFTQIGFTNPWRYILRTFVRPVAREYYTGYNLEGVVGRVTLDFVVRYQPDKQNSLRPHHDASTLTLNIALNQGGVDYQGGGTRFIRQNCTLSNIKPGWGILSPGRLTHLHEGLKTISGTRYILVSFIDQ